jgi:catechol 2,3-dioxygenase-like lactoylglutathione lyase family enzyme
MENGQLHHIEYYVDDLNKSNEFWSWLLEIFNYEKEEFPGGTTWIPKTGPYIVFVQAENKHLNANNNRHGNGLNHIAFQGSTLEHLKNLETELKKRNIKIIKTDDKHLCFEDPNNFAIEIFL